MDFPSQTRHWLWQVLQRHQACDLPQDDTLITSVASTRSHSLNVAAFMNPKHQTPSLARALKVFPHMRLQMLERFPTLGKAPELRWSAAVILQPGT